MGTRVEQSGEFVPRSGGASRRHLEDVADSLHRLPSAAEDLQVIIPRGNRTLLLQREFRITLLIPIGIYFTLKLIPPPVIDECRVQAQAWLEAHKDKPRNYIAAGVIVCLWLAALWLAWRWFAPAD